MYYSLKKRSRELNAIQKKQFSKRYVTSQWNLVGNIEYQSGHSQKQEYQEKSFPSSLCTTRALTFPDSILFPSLASSQFHRYQRVVSRESRPPSRLSFHLSILRLLPSFERLRDLPRLFLLFVLSFSSLFFNEISRQAVGEGINLLPTLSQRFLAHAAFILLRRRSASDCLATGERYADKKFVILMSYLIPSISFLGVFYLQLTSFIG